MATVLDAWEVEAGHRGKRGQGATLSGLSALECGTGMRGMLGVTQGRSCSTPLQQ